MFTWIRHTRLVSLNGQRRETKAQKRSSFVFDRTYGPDFPTRFNLSVVDLDEDGKCPKLCEMRTFENDAQEKWKFCVKSMSDCILARMNVSSICVRGSIARGAVVDFESDCDLVVVFENERADDQQINDLRSELESIRAKEFPFAKKIDVRFEVRGQMDAEQLFTLSGIFSMRERRRYPKVFVTNGTRASVFSNVARRRLFSA